MIEYDTIRFWVTNGYFVIGKEAILSIDLNDVTLNLQQGFREAGLSKSYKSQQSDIIFSSEVDVIDCSRKFTGYNLSQILATNKVYAANFYLNNEPVLQIEIHDLGDEYQTQEIRLEEACCIVTTLVSNKEETDYI